MNSLWTGSTWLLTTAAALSPLIALLIGFAGTDRLLRRQLAVLPAPLDPSSATTSPTDTERRLFDAAGDM
jgi:hypothetical protein